MNPDEIDKLGRQYFTGALIVLGILTTIGVLLAVFVDPGAWTMAIGCGMWFVIMIGLFILWELPDDFFK